MNKRTYSYSLGYTETLELILSTSGTKEDGRPNFTSDAVLLWFNNSMRPQEYYTVDTAYTAESGPRVGATVNITVYDENEPEPVAHANGQAWAFADMPIGGVPYDSRQYAANNALKCALLNALFVLGYSKETLWMEIVAAGIADGEPVKDKKPDTAPTPTAETLFVMKEPGSKTGQLPGTQAPGGAAASVPAPEGGGTEASGDREEGNAPAGDVATVPPVDGPVPRENPDGREPVTEAEEAATGNAAGDEAAGPAPETEPGDTPPADGAEETAGEPETGTGGTPAVSFEEALDTVVPAENRRYGGMTFRQVYEGPRGKVMVQIIARQLMKCASLDPSTADACRAVIEALAV